MNVAVPPDVIVMLAGTNVVVIAPPVVAAQSLTIDTVTGRLVKPAMMAAVTAVGSAGNTPPPVAPLIAVAWPVESRPSPPLVIGIAITFTSSPSNAAMVEASVSPPMLGS